MAHCLEDDQKAVETSVRFSDDPQMTLITRHLKEFSGVTDTVAVSVTSPLREVIKFHR